MNHYRIFLLAGALVLSGSCYGSAIYDITLATSSLVSNSAGPFALDFQLISGDTTTGVVNTASLTDFSFGNGGSAGTGSPFVNSGNVSGNLASAISLNTSNSFFNEYSQYFTPGNQLTFQLTLTGNIQPSTPDEFSFQLIDGTSTEVSTSDPSGGNSLFTIDITDSAPVALAYALTGDGLNIVPLVSPATSAAPEPPALLLLSAAGFVLAFVRRMQAVGARQPVRLR